MTPIPKPEGLPIWAVGARRATPGTPGSSELVALVRQESRTGDALLALLDARGVLGLRHLLSAWAHLGRARERGQSRLRDRGAEFLLFVAGDDQLPRAITKVGVQPDTEEFVVVGEKPRTPGPLLAAWALKEAPDVYPRASSASALDRLGILEAERGIVAAAQWEGLVLERVALLEMSAPHPEERNPGGRSSKGHARPDPAKTS
ncbi:MAG: KEOPS complex subunit Cgi121 [Thermoplasmata archaeon]